MKRYAVEIQYHGGAYFGWQRQNGQVSVQEKIESALNQLFNTSSIQIVGCGRTDSGVHARQSYFHVDLENLFPADVLKFKLNRMLAQDISVTTIHEVSTDFHARFDARSRTYRYYLHQEKNPFLNDRSLYFPSALNLEEMNRACGFLLGTQDFTSFSKLHTDVKTNICTVSKAQWINGKTGEFYFEITADRFLRNMVRAIVGTLLDVGLGNSSAKDVKSIIEKKNRSEAKISVPAQGLFLWEVKYDKLTD